MFNRSIHLTKEHSFFLFGARATGKSSLLKKMFSKEETLFIDLLLPNEFSVLNRNPEELSNRIKALDKNIKWIVLDEIQRIPKLLNLVHYHIENSNLFFALTGSSARKLKRGSANLLAGRALVYSLFPLTHRELGKEFKLEQALTTGTLPGVYTAKESIRTKMLQAYTHTYLREEIQAEQLVRALDPFHLFMEIAGQMSGKIINYSAIARECGASDFSVKEYFKILEDTLIGFHLFPYHQSIRKRQMHNPKFFIFDEGVQRSLSGTLTIPIKSKTSAFGDAFERWLICEIHRLIKYAENDFKLYYLRTKDNAEIDLIIERPGSSLILLEIKSTTDIREEHLTSIKKFAKDIPNSKSYILSRDPNNKVINNINIFNWEDGLKEIGL